MGILRRAAYVKSKAPGAIKLDRQCATALKENLGVWCSTLTRKWCVCRAYQIGYCWLKSSEDKRQQLVPKEERRISELGVHLENGCEVVSELRAMRRNLCPVFPIATNARHELRFYRLIPYSMVVLRTHANGSLHIGNLDGNQLSRQA